MLEINSQTLVSALYLLCTVEGVLGDNGMEWLYKEPDRLKFLNETLNNLSEELDRLGLKVSMETATNLKPPDEPPDYTDLTTYGKLLSHDLKNLRQIIKIELGTQKLYRLEPDETEFYKQAEHMFDDNVLTKFPEARFDLGQAAKCMAFERYTACVFHLVRPMESAVRMIGKQMGVTVEKNQEEGYLHWGVITNNINQKLKTLKESDNSNYEKWLRLHGMLECVRVAWRNEVMHPGPKYTGEEAREVFEAVKTFLKHLAEKL
ncbi:MAG: hypothetical protein OXI37_08490 [Gammaproteobacteria bacterium]|nr:hypothetical protein [Gammaproteobacteria bacterium]